MEIEINAAEGVSRSDAVDAHVRRMLDRIERRHGGRLTRVRVHLKDVNATKGGVDKVCTMEARPAGLDPVAVEAQDENVYDAARDAAGKLEKAVDHRIGRAEAHH